MTSIMKTFAIATVGLGLSAAPLFAQTVNVDYKDPAQLNGFRTYQIAHIETADPMLEGRLAAAIDRQLAMKGWHEVSENPAVEVTAVLADNNGPQRYPAFSTRRYPMQMGETVESIGQAAPGTLVVELSDAKTGQMLFRSTASDFLTINTAKNGLKLDQAVNKMSDSLPSTGFVYVTTGNFAVPDGNKF